MKKLSIITFLVAILFTLSACNINDDYRDDNPDDTELLQLTITELEMYNGDDGNPAYIAVNGVIYDVSGVAAWSSGTHNGGVAGTDVSDLIGSAPHGESILSNLTIVGELVE